MQNRDSLLIIAGRREYPRLMLEAAKSSGVRNIEVIAFKHETNPRGLNLADKVHWLHLGALDELISCIESTKIQNVILVGQISPSNLFSLRLDTTAKSMIEGLPIKNAHTIFTALINKIESIGVHIIPSHSYMDKYIPLPGVISARSPLIHEESDSGLGIRYLRHQGVFDVGQSVIVKSGYIVAVEAMEGTDKTILRGGKLGGNGTVVVKVPRLEHDFRFDVPVIGPTTIKNMAQVGATCLVIEAGSTLIFNRSKTVKLADKANICIYATESLN